LPLGGQPRYRSPFSDDDKAAIVAKRRRLDRITDRRALPVKIQNFVLTMLMPEISPREAERLVSSVPVWHHRFEIAPGVITPGNHDPAFLVEKMALPENLSGLSVLDIGASDGFFSLHLRRRGARVVAVDYRAKHAHGFGVMEQISGLEFEYYQKNLYEITRDELGAFDVVLFFGILYHFPDMIKALSLVPTVCDGQMFLETDCANEVAQEFALARYYRGSSLNNDITNFWSPNALCLRDMLYDRGFDVSRMDTWADRCFAACTPAPG
jgi:tRNA (mo5U34)-methyltransferase